MPLVFGETPQERLDRLILEGKRRLTETSILCWCPVGKHWIDTPYPQGVEADDDWIDLHLGQMLADHEACDQARRNPSVFKS